jgi:hypothetical protein
MNRSKLRHLFYINKPHLFKDHLGNWTYNPAHSRIGKLAEYDTFNAAAFRFIINMNFVKAHEHLQN